MRNLNKSCVHEVLQTLEILSIYLFNVGQELSVHNDNNSILAFFAFHLLYRAVVTNGRHTADRQLKHILVGLSVSSNFTGCDSIKPDTLQYSVITFVNFWLYVHRNQHSNYALKMRFTYMPSPNSSLMISLMLSP